MRVLILTVTAGQGHNQVAKSLYEYLQNEGAEAMYLDALEYINPVLKDLVSYGYLMSVKELPKVYGKAYRMAEKRDPDGKDSKFIKISNTILSGKLVKFVGEYMPDVIVCTHVFAAVLINYISDKIDKNIKTVGIITDFAIHPYWEDTTADYYITANEMLNNQAKMRGIDTSKLVPVGIPINPKFAERTDKRTARKRLGIPDIRTVLVMSGSMGYGKILSLMERLDMSEAEFQIISVCGRNERLKNEIDETRFFHNVYNYGYSDMIDVFMDAADCIVTKPGGLTTSEALAKGLPMIMANPIPGQEDRNVEFLLNNGAALKVSKTFPIDEALYQLFNNSERRKTISEILTFLGKPNAMRDCVDFIMKISANE